jgi:hypothetical protein
MVSTVTARPNHYETLGLKPTATREEIERAFALEINRPRAFGGLARLGIAYETLRDPAKRRAYDDSLGLRPEPLPPTARPREVRFSGSAQFLLAGFAASGTTRADDRAPPPPLPDPPAAPLRPPEPVAEPRMAPVIAAANRAIPRPESEPQPERLREAEDGPVKWKRTAVVLGVPVLAVGLVGAWAGSVAGNDVAEAGPPERAVTIALPRAKPQPVIDDSAAPEWRVVETRPERRSRAVDARRIRRAPVRERRALSDQQLAELPPLNVGPKASELAGGATGPAVAEAPPVAAILPISNAAVARTLRRVGYACGRVVSAAAAEGGAPGVYKVTCASGHSYRAAPVRGRYRFSRWGGR